MPMLPQSVADWAPKEPQKKTSEMFTPEAKDNKDSLTPDNALKRAVGGSGKPDGPYGKKGREF